MGAVTYVSDRVVIDWTAIELAALFAVVLGIAAAIGLQVGPSTNAATPDQFGNGASSQAAAGAAWATAEVVVAATMLVLLFVYNRLPEWLQSLVKWNVLFVLAMYLGAAAGDGGSFWPQAGLLVGAGFTYGLLDQFDVWWVANNALAVLLAVLGGSLIGLVFGVPGMALALIVLTVYDHVFANKQTWMFALGSAIVSARLPALFIRPSSWRLDWDELTDSFGADREDVDNAEDMPNNAWGLGTADLMLPAGFVVAVATTDIAWLPSGGLLVTLLVATGIIVACFRLRHEMLTRGSGAGLPALAAGALVPYVVITLVSGAV